MSLEQLPEWQIATVKDIKPETPDVKTVTLALSHWIPHQAGQHYDVRLRSANGQHAQRSYSIASEPERAGEIDVTIERLAHGEVSIYMHDRLQIGEQLEVRGPIGGYFVWDARAAKGPLLLIAGGSGVVPLMAMLRHRVASGSRVPATLLYSVRTPAELIYADELRRLAAQDDELEVIYTFTREQPPGWAGFTRRVDRAMLREVVQPDKDLVAYICGPTLFVESVANGLLQIGLAPEQIRTERFRPTGTTA